MRISEGRTMSENHIRLLSYEFLCIGEHASAIVLNPAHFKLEVASFTPTEARERVTKRLDQSRSKGVSIGKWHEQAERSLRLGGDRPRRRQCCNKDNTDK